MNSKSPAAGIQWHQEGGFFMYFVGPFSKRLRIFLLVCGILLVLFIVIDLTGFGRDALSVSVPLSEDSDVARSKFLAGYGWEISTVPTEVQDVMIPYEFQGVYVTYNRLQQAQGFDLTPFAGKTVKRYTYTIINYPGEQSARANLLMYRGKVIGGDVCSVALDGFMHGFDRSVTIDGLTYQTMQGAVA